MDICTGLPFLSTCINTSFSKRFIHSAFSAGPGVLRQDGGGVPAPISITPPSLTTGGITSKPWSLLSMSNHSFVESDTTLFANLLLITVGMPVVKKSSPSVLLKIPASIAISNNCSCGSNNFCPNSVNWSTCLRNLFGCKALLSFSFCLLISYCARGTSNISSKFSSSSSFIARSTSMSINLSRFSLYLFNCFGVK